MRADTKRSGRLCYRPRMRLPFPRRRFAAALHFRAAACTLLGSSLAWLVLGCGGSSPARPTPAARAAAKPVAAQPVDWLPAEAFALLHLDVDQIRSQLPLPLLAAELTVDQHTLLERTHTLIVALEVAGTEPALAGVFIGDYDARINPLLLSDHPQRASDPARELWLAGTDVWLRTPEGYWVGGERALAEAILTPPAARKQPLSSRPWTAAPNEPYFLSAALHVTPPLQDALRAQAERESFAALLAQVGPALLDLRDIRLSALPSGDGLRLVGNFDFASELGAQSGALVLRGLLAALNAAVPEGGAAPGSRAHAAATVMAALDAAQIAVGNDAVPALRGGAASDGTRVHAEISFDAPQLAALARLLQDDDEPEKEGLAVAAEPYQPPSAEQLAERERVARADPTFGRVLDKVLAQAGPDLELRDGFHPQTGKPGTPYLVVRVAQPNALAQRQQLRTMLRAKNLQVVPIARGFEGRPSELGIFRARDEPAVLIARGTGEARAEGTSKRLAALVRGWQKRTSLEIAVAADDYLAVELTAVPADPDRFVRELLELCPNAKADDQQRQLLEKRTLDCFLQ
jgi:hypothetical protein